MVLTVTHASAYLINTHLARRPKLHAFTPYRGYQLPHDRLWQW